MPGAIWRVLPSAGDVAFEVVDIQALVGDDVLDDVPDADEPHEVSALHDGQVALSAIGHDRHAFLDRSAGRNGIEFAAHRFPDGGVPGSLPMEDDPAGILPLRQDTDELVSTEDHDGSDVIGSHQLEGFVGGTVGIDGIDRAPGFGIEELSCGNHG